MNFLLIEGLKPFSVLTGFIVVLLIVEIGLMLVGLSSNTETDGAGDGMDAAPDVDGGLNHHSAIYDAEVLTADEIATLDVPPIRPHMGAQPPTGFRRRLLQLLGFGRSPLLVWLTSMAAGIAACGYALQLTLQAMAGAMLSGSFALLVVLVPGLLLGGRLANFVSRLIPSFESHGISGQTYNGRSGQVVIGVARRGEPAQVRWRDMYGTTHSLMAEPLRDDESIVAGTEVLIVKTRDRQPRIVSLSAS
jgi:hypothetical protein